MAVAKETFSSGDPYVDLVHAIVYQALIDCQSSYIKLEKVRTKKDALLKEAYLYPQAFSDTEKFKHWSIKYRETSERPNEALRTIAKIKRIRSKLKGLQISETCCIRTIRDCENFFNSAWFQCLSETDGKSIKNRLDKDLLAKGCTLLEQREREEEY